jgi:hypothetical protein
MKRCYKETGKCDGSDITEVLKTDLTSRSALFSGSTTSEYSSTLLTFGEALLLGTDVPNPTLSTSYSSTLLSAEKNVPVVTLSNFHSLPLFEETLSAETDVPVVTLSNFHSLPLFEETLSSEKCSSNNADHSSTLCDTLLSCESSLRGTTSEKSHRKTLDRSVKGSCESVRAPPSKEFHSKNVNPNVPKKPLLHYGSLSRSTLNERKKSEFTIKRLRF